MSETLTGNETQIKMAEEIRLEFFEKVSALKDFIKTNPLPVDKKFSWADEVDEWFMSKALEQLAEIENKWSKQTNAIEWIHKRNSFYIVKGQPGANHELAKFLKEFNDIQGAKQFWESNNKNHA